MNREVGLILEWLEYDSGWSHIPTETPFWGPCPNWVWKTRKHALVVGISSCIYPAIWQSDSPRHVNSCCSACGGRWGNSACLLLFWLQHLSLRETALGWMLFFSPLRKMAWAAYRRWPRGIFKWQFLLNPPAGFQTCSPSDVVLSLTHLSPPSTSCKKYGIETGESNSVAFSFFLF